MHALRTPSPCTRLSRAPSTMGPSDFLRLVTRDLRCARLSHRYRSSVWAVSEAAGSPKSTKVPWSACCGSKPRKSQHRLTCSVYAGAAFPFGGQGRPLRHDRFRGYDLPFANLLRPADSLSTLHPRGYPRWGQDSVLTGWLGVSKVAFACH